MFVSVALALCLVVAYLAYRNGSGETVSPSPNDVQSERRIPDVSPPSRIPDGMRAVAIRVDEVIGLVEPSNHVDVIKTSGQRSSMVLENVRVLNGKHDPEIVVLLVTPEDARKLASVGKGVRLSLAVRDPRKIQL
jgi:Flp pilus assembly protein CpaB